MTAEQPPTVLPAEVAPQPVPVAHIVQLDAARGMVVLWTFDCTGQHSAFLDAETAEGLAEHLKSAAQQARTGLIVASSVPNGSHPNGSPRR